MITFEVVYAPAAHADLTDIFDHIAERAAPDIARGYVERIQEQCESLSLFPQRGTLRPDLGAGLRTMGFERRATILFRVERRRRRVIVLGVFYGGREVQSRE